MGCDIGVCGDYLLFRGQLGALLEFEIADSSRKSKVAVDTSEIDKASRSTDTGFFACEKNNC